MKTKQNKTKKSPVKPFLASIKILGKHFNSTGSTVREAIENLKPEGKCAGMSILTVNGKDRVIGGMQTVRLFSASKLMREIALKNISLMFQ